MSLTLDLPSSPATHPVRRRWLGTPAYWLCQLLGWGGVLAAMVGPVLLYPAKDDAERRLVGLLIAFRLLFILLGLAGTHLLRVVYLRLLRGRRGWTGFGVRAAPWVIVICLLHTFWLHFLAKSIALRTPGLPAEYETDWELHDFFDDFSTLLALGVIWSGFYIGIRYFRHQQQAKLDAARLLAAAREAELGMLKAQINPHFLFNSLNSLRALLPLEQEKPRAAITRLAELLRASLHAGRETLVPLARELETVENYLALEKLRHEGRLRWRIEAEDDARERLLPPFLVQGLVENAVKHGVDRREAGGEVSVRARLSPADGSLRIEVAGPGRLGSAGEAAAEAGLRPSTGVGLSNARARLALLFGPQARLTLREAGEDGVVAEVLLPAPDGLRPAARSGTAAAKEGLAA